MACPAVRASASVVTVMARLRAVAPAAARHQGRINAIAPGAEGVKLKSNPAAASRSCKGCAFRMVMCPR